MKNFFRNVERALLKVGFETAEGSADKDDLLKASREGGLIVWIEPDDKDERLLWAYVGYYPDPKSDEVRLLRPKNARSRSLIWGWMTTYDRELICYLGVLHMCWRYIHFMDNTPTEKWNEKREGMKTFGKHCVERYDWTFKLMGTVDSLARPNERKHIKPG